MKKEVGPRRQILFLSSHLFEFEETSVEVIGSRSLSSLGISFSGLLIDSIIWYPNSIWSFVPISGTDYMDWKWNHSNLHDQSWSLIYELISSTYLESQSQVSCVFFLSNIKLDWNVLKSSRVELQLQLLLPVFDLFDSSTEVMIMFRGSLKLHEALLLWIEVNRIYSRLSCRANLILID